MSNVVATATQQYPAFAMPEADLIVALRSSLYPGATDNSIRMVVTWCKANGKDPFKRPVHIVPMNVKTGEKKPDGKDVYANRDIIMRGIEDYRMEAARTGQYAGIARIEFGPEINAEIAAGGDSNAVAKCTYPEWCEVVVIRLVQSMKCEFTSGRVYWKETYASKSRYDARPNDMWAKRPRGQLEKCFDPETEILTSEGFQRFDSVTGRVMQVTERGLEPTDVRPFCQEYSGEMIGVDGTRLNFMVTPNHDMITSLGRIEARDLYAIATTDQSKVSIPRRVLSSLPDCARSDAQIMLAGYFLADGSAKYRSFRIAVSRQYKIDALKELALHRDAAIKRDAGRVGISNGRAIVTRIDKVDFAYSLDLIDWLVTADKQIRTDALLSLSQRQARLLVDCILQFDGGDNGSGVRRLYQTNENVIRGFELAAVHAGYSVSARHMRQSDIGQLSSSLTISDAPSSAVYKKTVGGIASSLVKRMNVAGRVWCVTVPSGTIVVRRHGFSMLCGNCAEAMALRRAFPEAIGGDNIVEELAGREIDITPTAETKPAVEMPTSKSEKKPAAQTIDGQAQRVSEPPAPPAEGEDRPASEGERAHIKAKLDAGGFTLEEFTIATGFTLEALTLSQFQRAKAFLRDPAGYRKDAA